MFINKEKQREIVNTMKRILKRMKENSRIDHPSHYAEGRKYEPIAVIQDWKLDFCLGNTIKYISRAGRKNSTDISQIDKEIEDLKKAEWYLRYHINELEKEHGEIIDTDNPYQE